MTHLSITHPTTPANHTKKQPTLWNEAARLLRKNHIPDTPKNVRLVTLLMADHWGIYDFTRLSRIPPGHIDESKIRHLFRAGEEKNDTIVQLEKLAVLLGDYQNGEKKQPHRRFEQFKRQGGVINLAAYQVKSLSELVFPPCPNKSQPSPQLVVPVLEQPLTRPTQPGSPTPATIPLVQPPAPSQPDQRSTAPTPEPSLGSGTVTPVIEELYRLAPRGQKLLPDNVFNVVHQGDDYWCPFGDGHPSKTNKICFFESWGDKVVKNVFRDGWFQKQFERLFGK